MNKMIVVVFNNEEQAHEGLSALKSLHRDGDISLYASAVLSKNDNGEVEMKQLSDKGPIGMSVGALSGGLIGLIGGPVTMIFGATAGMLGGMLFDLNEGSVDAEFIDDVSRSLKEGKVALIAEIDEGWTVPLDKKFKELDGMVFRKNKAEVEDEQLDREVAETKAELEDLKAELKHASDDAKESIQTQIDKANEKLDTIKSHASKKLQEMKEEVDAKSDELSKQIQEADEKRMDKLELRLNKLKDNFERKKAKLQSVIDS